MTEPDYASSEERLTEGMGLVKQLTGDEVQEAIDAWIEESNDFDPYDADSSVRNCAEMLRLVYRGLPIATILVAEKAEANAQGKAGGRERGESR